MNRFSETEFRVFQVAIRHDYATAGASRKELEFSTSEFEAFHFAIRHDYETAGASRKE